MASNSAKLGVVIDIDDQQLTSLIEKIAGLQRGFADTTNKITSQTQAAIAKQLESVKQQVGIVAQGEKDIESIKAASVARIAALEAKITAAKEHEEDKQKAIARKQAEREEAAAQKSKEHEESRIASAQHAAEQLSSIENRVNETKKKGLDAVRQKIYEQELETRNLRVKRAFEEDAATKKEIQAQVNKVNTELQLFRSAEKDLTGGRTFTEQLEKNFKQAGGSIIIYEQALKGLESKYKEVDAQIRNSEDETQKYILNRQKETIEKEIAETKKLQHSVAAEHKTEAGGEHKSGGMEGMLQGAIGGAAAGAAIQGLESLKEHAKEAAAAQRELTAGIGGTGLAGEKLNIEIESQAKNSEMLSKKYVMTVEEAKAATGKVAAFSGKRGDELKKLTEDAIILSQSTGQSIEMVAKTLGKSTNEEIESSASKMGIALDKNMTAEERMAKIHEEAGKRKAAVDKQNSDSTKSLEKVMNAIAETINKVAGTLLTALQPAFDAILPIVEELGGLIGTILEPILTALTPVISLIADAFKQLAPVITELVQMAIQIAVPIIDALTGALAQIIPPVIEAVKVIIDALMPVFRALMPIITQLIVMFAQMFQNDMNVWIGILTDVLVPLIRDSVAPILMSLMPLIKMTADIMMMTMVPATKLVGGIMTWLIQHAIQPLINIFSGALTAAIKGTIAIVEEVVGAIKKVASVVGDVLSFFGGGDDKPKEAVKQQSKEIAIATEEGTNEVQAVKDKAEEARIKKEKAAKEKAAKDAAAHAKKEKKDAYTAEKEQTDINLADKKATIEIALANNEKTERSAKSAELQAQLEHDAKMLEIARTYHKGIVAATVALAKTEAEIRKTNFDNMLADNKQDEQDLLDANSEMLQKGLRSEKDAAIEEYRIKHDALMGYILLYQAAGKDTLTMNKELHKMEVSEEARHHKEIISISESDQAFEDNITKGNIDAMKDGFNKEFNLLVFQHDKEINDLQKQLKRKEISEDQYRRAKEQADNRSFKAIDDSAKKYDEAEKARKMQSLSFVTGPLINAFTNAGDQLQKTFFDKQLKGWLGANTVAGQVLRGMTDAVIKFIENYVIQKGLALAADLLFGTTEATTMAAVAAAAAPAAAMVSLASFGTNAIAADAGIAGTVALTQGLAVLHAATGGMVPEYLLDGGVLGSMNAFTSSNGTHLNVVPKGIENMVFAPKGTDTIPAMLTPGEGILTADEINRIGGKSGFDALRRIIKGYASGGFITNYLASGGLLGSTNAITFTSSTGAHTHMQSPNNHGFQLLVDRLDNIAEIFKKRPNPQILNSHATRLDMERSAFEDSQRHFSQ